jgi:16S rRNA (uracil1498-N3)-methyltransferase
MEADLRIVLAENEYGTTLKQVLARTSPSTADHRLSTVSLALGPEGGWTDIELSAFTDAGWTSASLGPTIQRAETAAVAALAISIAELA